MNYKWIDANELVARLEFTYGIQGSEYIQLLPLWITQGLRALRIMLPFEPATVKREVHGNICELPTDMTVLSAIAYDNILLNRSDKTFMKTIDVKTFNETVERTVLAAEETTENGVVVNRRAIPALEPCKLPDESNKYNYLLHYNGMCEFGFETGTVDIYYMRIPTTTDEYTGAKIPMIPDTEPVLVNLTWYVLMNLLYRGYKHPILSLKNNEVYTNPAKMYEITKGSARNSTMVWDSAKYESISKVLTAFTHNVDYQSRNFNV